MFQRNTLRFEARARGTRARPTGPAVLSAELLPRAELYLDT